MSDRFDRERVRDGVPEARLMRADAYYHKGWVSLVALEPQVTAHVTGETGNVYVVHAGARDGSDARCTCPDFAEHGLICKHVVATVEAVLRMDAVDEREASGRLDRLRDLLEMEGRDADALISAARDDPALLRELEGDPVG